MGKIRRGFWVVFVMRMCLVLNFKRFNFFVGVVFCLRLWRWYIFGDFCRLLLCWGCLGCSVWIYLSLLLMFFCVCVVLVLWWCRYWWLFWCWLFLVVWVSFCFWVWLELDDGCRWWIWFVYWVVVFWWVVGGIWIWWVKSVDCWGWWCWLDCLVLWRVFDEWFWRLWCCMLRWVWECVFWVFVWECWFLV